MRRLGDKGRAKVGKSLLFQGFPLFFYLNGPLKCVSHIVSSTRKFRLLTNGWLTFFHVAKWLVARTRDSVSFVKRHCVLFPTTVPKNIKVKNKNSVVYILRRLLLCKFSCHLTHRASTLGAWLVCHFTCCEKVTRKGSASAVQCEPLLSWPSMSVGQGLPGG